MISNGSNGSGTIHRFEPRLTASTSARPDAARPDPAMTIVAAFMPMMKWREYLTQEQSEKVADGLRQLATEFEKPESEW